MNTNLLNWTHFTKTARAPKLLPWQYKRMSSNGLMVFMECRNDSTEKEFFSTGLFCLIQQIYRPLTAWDSPKRCSICQKTLWCFFHLGSSFGGFSQSTQSELAVFTQLVDSVSILIFFISSSDNPCFVSFYKTYVLKFCSISRIA